MHYCRAIKMFSRPSGEMRCSTIFFDVRLDHYDLHCAAECVVLG